MHAGAGEREPAEVAGDRAREQVPADDRRRSAGERFRGGKGENGSFKRFSFLHTQDSVCETF